MTYSLSVVLAMTVVGFVVGVHSGIIFAVAHPLVVKMWQEAKKEKETRLGLQKIIASMQETIAKAKQNDQPNPS